MERSRYERWPTREFAQGRGDMIINVGNTYPSVRLSPTALPRPVSSTPTTRSINDDRIKVSSFGDALTRAVETSSLRIAQTRAIRAEIVAGTYETPERIHGTVERILDVIA